MPRTWCLVLVLCTLPLGSASAGADPKPGANAALKYWQAFATLPRFTNAEHKKLDDSLSTPLDEPTRAMVDRAEYALKMMHYAAALPRCEWGLDNEEGLEHRMPHAEATRTLSSLVCLRARLRFEAGQSREALDDIVAALTLGRHLSLDGSLISILVCYRNERLMGETLALYLPRLDAPTVKNLKTRLDALPAWGSPAVALDTFEIRGFDWWVDKVKATKDKETLLACLGSVFDQPPDQVRAFVEACDGTKEGVLKMAEEARPGFAVLAAKLKLPLDRFEREWKEEETKRAGNPVFKRFFPALAQMGWRTAQAEVRRAMLSAALDVQLHGQEALKKHVDPVVGGSFEYVAFEGGFELRSKVSGRPQAHRQDDQPVVLTVGRRGS